MKIMPHHLTLSIRQTSKVVLRSALVAGIALIPAVVSSELLHPSLLAAWSNSRKSPLANQASGSVHTLSFPYYTTQGNWESRLTLNNAAREVLQVSIKLYSLDGTPLPLQDQTLQPLDHLSLRLGDLIKSGKFKEGSLEVSFKHDNGMALGPQLTIADSQAGISFDMEPIMGPRSSRLEALWWSSDEKMRGQFMLSNTKEQPLDVKVSFDWQGAQTPALSITLLSHQTAVLDIDKIVKELNPANNSIGYGGISITHDGNPEALIAHGFVVNKEKGFASNLYFVDPAGQKSLVLDGTGLLLARPALASAFTQDSFFDPFLTLRNTSASPQTARVTVQYTVGGKYQTKALPAVSLKAHEVRPVDFSSLLASLNGQFVDDAGIRIETSGVPGTIIGQLASVSNFGMCVDAPLLSVRPNAARSGAHPFNLNDDSQAVLHLKNIGNKPTKAIVHVLYETGDYALDLVKMQPGESVAIDIGKLATSGKPDIHGNILPASVARGQVTWVQHGGQTLIGRLIQLNSSRKSAANFSCGGLCNCEPEFDYAVFSPSDYNGSPNDEGDGNGQTGPLTVYEWDHYLGQCSSLPLEGPFTADATFESLDLVQDKTG